MVRSNLSQKLRDRRRKIDHIDQKLLSLLNQRLRIALEIGKIKEHIGEKTYDPKREKNILGRLSLRNRGPLNEDDLKKTFATIIKVCRKSQK